MLDAISNVPGEAASATVAIAKNGDVVFTVGPERRRLQIYSLFLKTVSPVFNAMLGPHFKEGQQLTQRGEAEIPLEGDNAVALEIIFSIIHGRNHAVPDELSPEDLLQIAIVGDKYDCFAPLKFAIQIWSESAYQNTNPGDSANMWTLAMAALIFGGETVFAKVTSTLILAYNEPYINLVRKHDDVLDCATQYKIAAMLETKRVKLLKCLMEEVLSANSTGKKSKHRLDWPSEFNRRAGNFGQRPLCETLAALEQNKYHRADEWEVFGGLDQICTSISNRVKAVHEAEGGGLCLNCAKFDELHDSHAPLTVGA